MEEKRWKRRQKRAKYLWEENEWEAPLYYLETDNKYYCKLL